MTFGIPTDVFPVDTKSNVQVETHNLWMEQQRKRTKCRKEQQEQRINYQLQPQPYGKPNFSENQVRIPSSDHENENSIIIVSIPGPVDVLLGRDKMALCHTGNFRYSQVIQEYHERYDSASRNEKTVIATEIVEKVKGYGGRFLKAHSMGWTVVEDKIAREKVSNAFRSRRKTASFSTLSSKSKGTSFSEPALEQIESPEASKRRVDDTSSCIRGSKAVSCACSDATNECDCAAALSTDIERSLSQGKRPKTHNFK